MKANISFYFIDTFTSVAGNGNPTVVYLLQQPVTKDWMQQAAANANVPVTAFVQLQKSNCCPIFYFTPVTEIPACGHATLAAAKAMNLQEALVNFQFITVEKRIVEAVVADELITITYPRYNTINVEVKDELLQSLGLTKWKPLGFCKELETLFIEVTAEDLYKVQPDFKALQQSSTEIKEVVITAASNDERHDYLLRSFCPWIGIDEDPVTGSVHSVLAGYWANKLNKAVMKVFQASEAGGELFVTYAKDKVELSGNTVVRTNGIDQYKYISAYEPRNTISSY